MSVPETDAMTTTPISILIEEALALHRRGNLQQAEQRYRAVLTVDAGHVDALHLLGVLRVQQGRQVEAIDLIGAAIRAMPAHAEAHNNLAAALNDLGRHAEALESCRRALQIRPDYAEALVTAGAALSALDRNIEAVDAYRRAIALRPDYAEAFNNLGNALAKLEQRDEAMANYRKALQLRPGYVQAHHNLGAALSEAGRHDEALASCDRALALEPDYADAHNTRGNALANLKRHEEAVTSYRRAIAIRPHFALAHNNLGAAFGELDRREEALASGRRAVSLRPAYAEAHYNIGNALRALGRHDEALASYERAIFIDGEFSDAHNALGNALSHLDRHAEAITHYHKAIAAKPDFAGPHYNMGVAFEALGRPEEAMVAYDTALAMQPENAEAHWNRSLALLTLGDFARGWPAYEWRWRRQEAGAFPHHFTAPRWSGGEDLTDKTILLHWEQGYGDTLQFVRYAPLVASRGARVLLQVQGALKTLLGGLPGVAQVLSETDALPAFDYQCPLMSLPLAFGTDLGTIPAVMPYLHADPAKSARWKTSLGSDQRLKVGLAWAGSPAKKGDRDRSMTFAQFAPLAGVDGVQYVSLQKRMRAAKPTRKSAASPRDAVPPGMNLVDHTDELADFAETAALTSQLDLVITVDTAVAHLAGALGKPVWILSRYHGCWRWLNNRDDSPWYPTARLFRQAKRGDWTSVMLNVRATLMDRVGKR